MGAKCKWDLENKHQHACMQCVRDKEKCEWLEVVGSASGSRSRDMKGKGKVVVTSPRAGEKRKHIKKSAAKVINSNIEIIARPSNVSRSGSGHALLQHMDHLILVVENLTECQDHVQLQSLIQSKDQLVQKYPCSTDPTWTSCIIPGPRLASCTYHPLSPYLTLDIFPY